MIEMRFLAQAAEANPIDSYAFWLMLSDRWLPFLTIVAGIVATYLKLRSVEKGINGRMTQLINTSSAAAKAEGKLEGVTEVAPAVAQALTPPAQAPVQVQVALDPDARPGGRRAYDPPTSPPHEVDPSTHAP